MNNTFIWIAGGRGIDEGLQYRCIHGPLVTLERGEGYGDSQHGNGNGTGVSSGYADSPYMGSRGAWYFLLCTDVADLGAFVVNNACRMMP